MAYCNLTALHKTNGGSQPNIMRLILNLACSLCVKVLVVNVIGVSIKISNVLHQTTVKSSVTYDQYRSFIFCL